MTGAGARQGIFRFVDQETITTGSGMVWLVVNGGGPMVATGARVSGLGQVGPFAPVEIIPGTNNCTYGDVAIGPGGQVMNVCTLTESGQGGGSLFVSVDPDGLGPAGFGDRVKVVDTHVGGFDFIPAESDRSIDAEPGLAWDRTGGPHEGRAYLVYTLETKNESSDTDVEVRYSDDAGLTWSPPVRVNDDTTRNSQFLPKIALDPTSGQIGVVWYDSRNDLGKGGPGDTDGIVNTDAQFWGRIALRRANVHPEYPDQRRDVELPRLGKPHRLWRLLGARLLWRRPPPGLVRQLEQRRPQSGRDTPQTRHLLGRRRRAVRLRD